MLRKYKRKKENICNKTIIIWKICMLVSTTFFVLACIYDKKIFIQIGMYVFFITSFLSLFFEKIIALNLKKRSQKEIQEFEEKVPIEKKVRIYINWEKLAEEYNSLSIEEKKMFQEALWMEQTGTAYLIRNKELDGDSFSIEYDGYEGISYKVYSCMSKDYDKMIKLIKEYYIVK